MSRRNTLRCKNDERQESDTLSAMGRFQLIAAVAAGLFANVAWLYLGGLDPVAIDFQRF